MTGSSTLRQAAARAGVTPAEYAARLEQGQVWCYRCLGWHRAEAFPPDARSHTGRAGFCEQSIRAEVHSSVRG